MATLMQGSRGNDVATLQLYLQSIASTFNRPDLAPGQTDGIYGPKTAAAVSGIQRLFGLQVTGQADDTFQASLAEILNDPNAYASVFKSQSIRVPQPPYQMPSTGGVMGGGIPIPGVGGVDWKVIGIVAAVVIFAVYMVSDSSTKSQKEKEKYDEDED